MLPGPLPPQLCESCAFDTHCLGLESLQSCSCSCVIKISEISPPHSAVLCPKNRYKEVADALRQRFELPGGIHLVTLLRILETYGCYSEQGDLVALVSESADLDEILPLILQPSHD